MAARLSRIPLQDWRMLPAWIYLLLWDNYVAKKVYTANTCLLLSRTYVEPMRRQKICQGTDIYFFNAMSLDKLSHDFKMRRDKISFYLVFNPGLASLAYL
jgi:hypothetical protein